MTKLIQICKDLIQEKKASVGTLSEIIGKLTSSIQAVFPAPLHYRHFLRLQVKGLFMGKGYETEVPLSEDCQGDLQWWIDQMSNWNGRSIITPAPDLTITTDASLKGWEESSSLHINALEQLHVYLEMDNRTAVAYLLKMGRTRSPPLLGIVQELWEYA